MQLFVLCINAELFAASLGSLLYTGRNLQTLVTRFGVSGFKCRFWFPKGCDVQRFCKASKVTFRKNKQHFFTAAGSCLKGLFAMHIENRRSCFEALLHNIATADEFWSINGGSLAITCLL